MYVTREMHLYIVVVAMLAAAALLVYRFMFLA